MYSVASASLASTTPSKMSEDERIEVMLRRVRSSSLGRLRVQMTTASEGERNRLGIGQRYAGEGPFREGEFAGPERERQPTVSHRFGIMSVFSTGS